jgi:hypothetical protein
MLTIAQQDALGEKLFFFLSGIVIGVPTAVFFEVTFHLWFTGFGVVTIVAPLVEEFAKASTLFYRFERAGKALVRNGLLAGLGFGAAEFLVYVQNGVPFLVRLPAIGFHAAGTAIVAYGIYRRDTVKYYLLAVGLHFLNNFFAALGFLWFIGGLGATVASYYFAWKFYRLASRESAVPIVQLAVRFCTSCGARLTTEGRYCPNCGSPN